jgi:hypothetical protein
MIGCGGVLKGKIMKNVTLEGLLIDLLKEYLN